MNITKKLERIRDILTPIMNNVAHYTHQPEENRYIVWQEDGEARSLEANNQKAEQTVSGTIDLYTKTEYDPAVEEIQNALNAEQISFSLNYSGYEKETGFIHYEWVFEV